MSTTTNLNSLVINYLTQAQYDAAEQAGLLNENQLYLTPATSYILPVATSDILGGIQTGYITSGNNRAVQLDNNGNAYVVQAEIIDNITGSGTSDYLAKFNGTNTITNGPAFGSETTTYLRNDGSWATPVDATKLPLTGGTVTGNTTFQNTVSIDEATIGDLVVTGNATITNNLQFNTINGTTASFNSLRTGSISGTTASFTSIQATSINGVTVGTSPKFTDTLVTISATTGTGDVVTAVTAANGKLTIAKNATAGVLTFPDLTTITSYQFEGAYKYSISGTATLITQKHITTLYGASFPNVTSIESYGLYGQLSGSFYFPAIISISQLSTSAFAYGGIIHLPNFNGTISSVSSYFSRAGGIVASRAILSGFYSSANVNLQVLTYTTSSSNSLGVLTYAPLRSLTAYSITSLPAMSTLSASQYLEYVNMPSVTYMYEYCFYSYSKLKTAIFPKCTSIQAYTFYKCSALTSVSFPVCTSIASSAFISCSNLSSVNFPACTSIWSYAFSNCTNLQMVSVSKCTYFGYYAFAGCSKLSKLYINGVTAVPSMYNAYTFINTPLSNSTYLGYFGSIYVPASLYNAFKTATYWSNYSARIVSV